MQDINLEKLYINSRIDNITGDEIVPLYRPGGVSLGAGNLNDIKAGIAPAYTSTLNTQLFSSTSTVAITATANTVPSANALLLKRAGTYMVVVEAVVQYTGATFAANRTLTVKLRRTNNTAADLETRTYQTDIVTTKTSIFQHITFIAFVTTTLASVAGSADSISLTASLDVVPTAGALNITNIQLKATRLQT